ncbi:MULTISPECIES: hypothetical protein [unclassified Hymenobacter]|uniref:hypothetical protein n=1 Tax=unclassified Hymenobacter TaxID=2615202 RepID=UPI001AAD05D0|nr:MULTISPECIES: hypothetical protein [unclassified Hymenobacter]
MPEIITATSRLGLLQKEQAISGIGSIQIEEAFSEENGYKDKLAAQHCAWLTSKRRVAVKTLLQGLVAASTKNPLKKAVQSNGLFLNATNPG